MSVSVKKSKEPILLSLMVFCMIYFSHDTMLFGQNSNNFLMLVGKAMPFVLDFVLLVLNARKKLSLRGFIATVVLISLQLLSCLVHSEPINNYLFVFSNILFAYLLLSYYSFSLFASSFVKVVKWLTIYSIVFWLASSIAPSLISHLPVAINSNGLVYYNAIFTIIDLSARSGVVKNMSIFREGGVFVIYLSLALLFALLTSQTKLFTYIVLSIGILTSFSTAGFISAILILLYCLFFKCDARKRILLLSSSAFVLFFLLLFTNLLSLDGPLFSKFDMSSNSYGSFLARYSSITTNLKLFISNPVFGIGRYGLFEIKELGVAQINPWGTYRFVAVDNTNSILIGFAAFGAVYGIVTVLGIFNHFRHFGSSTLAAAIFLFVVFFLLTSNEDITQNPLYFIFIIDGLSRLKHPKVLMNTKRSLLLKRS